MSDLAVDVVLGVSFAGPPGWTPITFARGSFSTALAVGAFTLGGAANFSVQPATANAITIARVAAVRSVFMTLMVNSG